MPLPIVYIHGFSSSGHSYKGRVLAQRWAHVFRPSLSHIPDLAIETLEEVLRALGRRTLLVGSSLGGFYAHYLSARHHLPAVLINPALRANAALEKLVGMNRHYYDGSRFEFTRGHLDTLARFEIAHPAPESLLVMLQMGDELLDHRQTVTHLAGARFDTEPHGSHSYDGFERKLGQIAAFADEMSNGR